MRCPRSSRDVQTKHETVPALEMCHPLRLASAAVGGKSSDRSMMSASACAPHLCGRFQGEGVVCSSPLCYVSTRKPGLSTRPAEPCIIGLPQSRSLSSNFLIAISAKSVLVGQGYVQQQQPTTNRTCVRGGFLARVTRRSTAIPKRKHMRGGRSDRHGPVDGYLRGTSC